MISDAIAHGVVYSHVFLDDLLIPVREHDVLKEVD